MQSLAFPEPRTPEAPGLTTVASRFEHASPELLRARTLLQRQDTKFVVPADRAVWILAGISADYLLLPSQGKLLGRYRTIYFDTPDLLCFNAHRRGRRPRHKVRIRHYLDLGRTFFEIKSKHVNEVTDKQRREQAFGDEGMDQQARQLVAQHTTLPCEELEPATVIDFSRMTLLGKNTEERMTIDVNLAFQSDGARRSLDAFAVFEVKQRQIYRRSPIMRALRAHNFRPRSASKYCLVMALSHPRARINNVRPLLRAVERIRLG